MSWVPADLEQDLCDLLADINRVDSNLEHVVELAVPWLVLFKEAVVPWYP